MEANELRIGNLIYDSLLKINDNVNLHILHRSLYEKESFLRYKPIPLTEEWLLKFGFEFHSNHYINEYPKTYFTDKISIRVFKKGKILLKIGHLELSSEDKNSNFKYVHQLQNLYFALTGEEINVK